MNAGSTRRAIKRAIDACCAPLVAPAAWMCALEKNMGDGEAVFAFWSQLVALVPGPPGVFVRRAFYKRTLDGCGTSFFVGFGALFSHRCTVVGEDVYIGPYAIVGSSRLGRGCLIGSRASIISGGARHVLQHDGWTPTDLSRLCQIDLGEYAWIGEGSLVMADVGHSAVVAAGTVVSSRVPPGVVVAGNPARFVKPVAQEPAQEARPINRAV